ncbi:Vesicle transport through interaction with t-SNAREs homolog 1A [Strongyloides ratti]|uniref:Vesicle transport through interaction with t-SNAREs homolog 1A n=1 Tax=Strongyloides ratti TaxID=34506 RepID=A0A090KVU8_STRRB|nr:Vesicle transport through interaction with t-SNAREs homolog 1A [Strongyloides ratti]CEF60001.1 Vesicle transport through interaction with t-SNAREs homolog 1A [Strongyloides ratti]
MSSNSELLNILQQFEKQYSVTTGEITANIGQLKNKNGSEKAAAINEIQKTLNEVGDLLDQMELSVRDFDINSPERTKYDLRVRSYRSDKKQLEIELQKALKRINNKENFDELMHIDNPTSYDIKDKLIANTERLERGSRKIEESYRIALETEDIGTTVLQDLSSQRETLNRARERLRETGADLLSSDRLISQMIRRLVQNRLFLLLIILLLTICFLIMMYNTF